VSTPSSESNLCGELNSYILPKDFLATVGLASPLAFLQDFNLTAPPTQGHAYIRVFFDGRLFWVTRPSPRAAGSALLLWPSSGYAICI